MSIVFKSVFALSTAAAVFLGSLGTASAATVGVTDVGGIWTQLAPMQPSVKGLNTNAVSWGTPYNGTQRGNPNGHQSGYSFVGAAAGDIKTDTEFDLGTFTHINFVINAGTAITSARLGVAISLVIGNTTQVVNNAFNFLHDETLNNPINDEVCANGGANGAGVNSAGCADRVEIEDNRKTDQTFIVDGFEYILEITGFTVAGQLFSEFWTTEGQTNSAVLRARFTLVGPTEPGPGPGPEPIPSPVPLPAAGWLMLAGLGVLASARAGRRA